MNGNKLLTGFLVLGMGLSLVACSSDKPEPKKEEAKVLITKLIANTVFKLNCTHN